MNRALDVATSYLASALRLGDGRLARTGVTRPDKLLELYEFEACPFCRRVREALTAFDLPAMIYPCPKGGGYREVARERGGKLLFPFLVDPNTGVSMYESAPIVHYLAKTYAGGRAPLSLGPLSIVSGSLASGVRGGGRRARPARRADQPLVLYGFEGSPYCRIARERLCELGLAYQLVNVGKGSAARRAFVERSGKMQVPYLIDPNRGAAMFESADIAAYLEKTYALA